MIEHTCHCGAVKPMPRREEGVGLARATESRGRDAGDGSHLLSIGEASRRRPRGNDLGC